MAASGGGSKPRTRHSSGCKMSDYVGAGKEFSLADVPTNRALIRRGLLLRDQKCQEGIDYRHYTVKEIARDLAPILETQWQKANDKFVFPVILSRQRIQDKIIALWKKVFEVAKGKGKAAERDKVEESLDKLMDIVYCKCSIIMCHEPRSTCPKPSKCKVKAHALCTCPKEWKVPVLDLLWLRSQREKFGEKGGMGMSSCDHKETKKQVNAAQNKAALALAEEKRDRKLADTRSELREREDDQMEEIDQTIEMDEDDDMEIQPPSLTVKEKQEVRDLVACLLKQRLGKLGNLVTRYLDGHGSMRNYMPVLHTAAESMRFDVSPAAAAAVATGFLKDLIAAGHLSEQMDFLAMDPNKLRRARQSVMTRAKEKEEVRATEEKIESIYFDGRKDKTRAMVPDARGQLHPKIIKEEHVSVTWEPHGRYLTHFTPEPAVHPDKPAKKVAEALYDVLVKHNATETVINLGGDSYNGNTGWRGGTNPHLEKMLGHKCHWSVCLCHTNELPLRHLIEQLDGPTSSKDGFTGPIGKLLSKVHEMELDPNWQALPGGEDLIDLPDDIVKGLCTDANICYQYCQALKSGILPPKLLELKPGPIVHSRWLTTGEAVLFMWPRKHGLQGKDRKNLELLVKFCLQSYFKLYFDIKVKHHLIHGPYHVLTQLCILRTLPKKVQNIVTPYIRTGAWYSHSECILLSLLGSADGDDRQFAVDMIMKIRGQNELGDTSVRPRLMPKLNLKATTLRNMITWKVKEAHEPIFTCKLTREQLKELLIKPFDVPKFSIHTQSTERCVKQVTEAAAAVVGQDRRDGFVRARLHSREEMPVFKTKKQILVTF